MDKSQIVIIDPTKPSTKEVATLISQVISAVKEVRANLKKEIDDSNTLNKGLLKDFDQEIRIKLDEKLESRLEAFQALLSKDNKQVKGEFYKSLNAEVYKLEKAIREIEPFNPNQIESKFSEVINQLEKRISDIRSLTNVEIRDSLETLKDEERLDVSAIKGIEKLVKKLVGDVKNFGKTIYVGGGSSGGGRIVKAYDLSSQLNGVLKTFNLPAVWRVISVHSSSAPFTFRETTDYTWTPTTITFTSEIDATSTLNTAQSVTIIYSEA